MGVLISIFSKKSDHTDCNMIMLFISLTVLNLVIIDETFGKKKNRNKTRNCRRLRKSYQLSESDDEENSQPKNIVKSGIPFSELESLDEDNHPISSLCNNRTKGETPTAAEEKEAIEHKVLHESSDLKTELDGDFVTGVNGNTDGIIDDGQLNG